MTKEGTKEPSEAAKDYEKIGKVDKKEYEKLKRRAIKFEKGNDQCILVIPCDGDKGWCEVSERSALLYKYKVCMEIGAPITMTDDLDSFYIQYEIGRIRTRGFDTVRRRLKQVGLYKNEREEDRVVIFQLAQRYTKADFEEMWTEEKTRRESLNNIVKVTFSDPVFYQKMIEVATRLHRICYRRLDKLASATNGKRMVELIDAMIRKYYKMSENGSNKVAEQAVEDWEEMWGYAHGLIIEVQIATGLRLWTHDTCASIGESVIFLEERIIRHIEHEKGRLKKK
ncbi:MAG: hypothetical protein Q4A79_01190 [Candidatus Saccharibacteria bacterium]|nr:hypothetical protein [Candidatus Saccharibacteria bacterium]